SSVSSRSAGNGAVSRNSMRTISFEEDDGAEVRPIINADRANKPWTTNEATSPTTQAGLARLSSPRFTGRMVAEVVR
ncbi:MAG: hypothetical protein AAF449_23335, partial [Myxococcota bacterium]